MAETRYEELKALLEIDKLNLDEHIEQQPSLFFEVSELLALAISERDASKDVLNRVDAELYSKHRKRIEKKENKVTEAMINNAVILDDEHISAAEDYNDAREQADQLLALKEAWKMRSRALQDLAGLYTSNYFERAEAKGGTKTEEYRYQRNRQRLAEGRKKRVRAK